MEQIFASPSQKSFFSSIIHAGRIPEDAVEVDPQLHVALVTAANMGQHVIDFSASPPTLVAAPAPAPEVVAANRVRAIDEELRQIDLDGARPSRDIALAIVAGDPPPSFSVNKLDELEARAVTLREERATLSTP